MATMLPTAGDSSRSLAGVLTSCLASLEAAENPFGFAPAERAAVVLVDGLGASALRQRSGHARTLAPRLNRGTIVESGFPTTTVAALATLTTGVRPGEHGMVGYRVVDPGTGRLFNQLSEWTGEPDPATWQRATTVFERAAELGIPAYAVGPERYRGSAFTAAVLRGARYVGARSIADRFREARRLFDAGGRCLVYVYVPELDSAAHAKGWESDAWTRELEATDAAVGWFAERLRPAEGAVVTADHGVVDVPARSHVLFDSVPELVAGVGAVGGDPRCLQLYAEDGADVDALLSAWQEHEGGRSWVASREQAIEAGWFGPSVAEAVAPRIGDILVAARSLIAYYDGRDPNPSSQSMVGQHGSFSPDEVRIPVIGFGAFEG